ncbi:hypothetical protein SLS64_011350 [Diaporthe eres]|uniref:Nephrocystin 3-like N-terminal domain-containing protein n=1 Tax=Diaporthe eres TaxID=83184 RepID=A0ABR1NMF8_DIAER
MSGLEPIAALGLACNILQLAELGKKTIDRIKAIYQGGNPDEELERSAAILEELATEVKKHSQPGRKKYEEILFKSAATCATVAGDLGEELRFLSENAKKGSLVSALKVTTRVAWRQRRLQRLRRNLDAEEQRMQTSLLAQVWSSTNATGIELSGVRRQLRYFIEQYREGRRETTELVSVENLNTRQHVTLEAERTNEAVGLVGQKVDRLTAMEGERMGERVRERFLESLKYPGFNQRRNQIDAAYEDTLEWIFVGDNDDSQPSKNLYEDKIHPQGAEHPDEGFPYDIKWDSFSNWLSSTDFMYWISGKPGSGKTTVVKYILADERTKRYLDIWCPGCAIVSHYFWLPGPPMQRNMEGLLCSLLYQLLKENSDAFMQVISSDSGQKTSYTDWSSAELHSALMRALDSCENGVCLFLDGIDEIKPEDGTKDGIPEFLNWALELSQRSKIKLCLASRPDPHILETRLSRYPRLRLQDLNYQDLMAYAKGRVKIPEEAISAEKNDLIQHLADKAEGVFLWLILAIKSVNEGFRNDDSAATMEERIDRLPLGLDSLYKDMWARAGADNPSEYRQTAALYFKLLLAPIVRLTRGVGINTFDIMLATTCLADHVLHAIADPSKLVREDDMLQQCREVEKKLNIHGVCLEARIL